MNHRFVAVFAVALFLVACASSATRAEEAASAGLEAARAGELTLAISHFERALELDEENPKARYNLALANLVLRRGADAVPHLRRFLERRPEDAPARFELGRALSLAGEREAAIGELQRAAGLGFADFQAIEGGGFESIEGDIRFVQLRALIAQRAGVPAYEGGAESRAGYGGIRLPVPLPGSEPVRPCEVAGAHEGTACGDEAHGATGE